MLQEAWLGSVSATGSNLRMRNEGVAFWKLFLPATDEYVWYWDDGVSYIDGTGFVRDLWAAKAHIGDTLWTKDIEMLYTLDDQDIIRLRNLEGILFEDVRWVSWLTSIG